MAEYIDRRAMKYQAKTLLADAQVSPKAMTALYLGLILVLNLVSCLAQTPGMLATFVTILTTLMSLVLHAGYAMYMMAIRRGERVEFLALFDGFSFVGKIIALNIAIFLFTFLWSLCFVIPGIIAFYRYRFALFNLYENPELGVMQALNLSKRQTFGYKGQLFMLDLSYFGWSLLSTLPSIFYSVPFYQDSFAAASGYMANTISFVSPETFSVTALPVVAWTLIIGLWNLVVSLFYYPNYMCVELGYFETAKRTSGTTSSRTWQTGPDNMGGF